MRILTYMMAGVVLIAMALLYPSWTNAGPTTGVDPQVITLAVNNSDGSIPASLVHWRGWRGGLYWGGYYPYRSFYYRPYSYRHFYRPYGYYYPYRYYAYYPSGSWYVY